MLLLLIVQLFIVSQMNLHYSKSGTQKIFRGEHLIYPCIPTPLFLFLLWQSPSTLLFPTFLPIHQPTYLYISPPHLQFFLCSSLAASPLEKCDWVGWVVSFQGLPPDLSPASSLSEEMTVDGREQNIFLTYFGLQVLQGLECWVILIWWLSNLHDDPVSSQPSFIEHSFLKNDRHCFCCLEAF